MNDLNAAISAHGFTTMEEMVLDPINYFSEDYEDLLDDYISESFDDEERKETLINKIINFIEKIFSTIADAIGKVAKWLYKIFKGNKKSKLETADDMIVPIIGAITAIALTPQGQELITNITTTVTGQKKRAKRNKRIAVGVAASVGAGVTAGAGMYAIHKLHESADMDSDSTAIKQVSLKFKKSPGSTVNPPPDIDLLMKPMMISLNGATEKIRIKWKHVKGSNESAKAFMFCFSDDYMAKLDKCIQTLQGKSINLQDVVEAYNDFVKVSSVKNIGDEAEISLKQLTEAQKKINDLIANLNKIDNSSDKAIFRERKVVAIMNDLSNRIASIQVGFNSFNLCMSRIYVIDAAYAGSISNPKQMDEFVNKMIDAGYPPKYVMSNIYASASDSLKGGCNPLWGQTRMILCPKDKSACYKVAVNGWGREANKNEIKIHASFRHNNGENMIPSLQKIYDKHCVVQWEHIKDIGGASDSEVTKLKQDISEFVKSKNIAVDIVGDFGPSNVGYTANGIPVCVDFSWNPRRSSQRK